MKIDGHHREWNARDEAALQQVLAFRDDLGGGLFWLSHDEDKYPTLVIRISGDLADVHYFPREGHPGFRALADPSVQKDEPRTFIYEGCDPATGEETPGEFVLSVPTAMDLAMEFRRTGKRSVAVSWSKL